MTALQTLLSAEQIQHRVKELGQKIASDYGSERLVLIGTLKGSFIFMADLCRAISEAQRALGLPENQLICDFLGVQSYGDATHTSGVVKITIDLSHPVEGQHLLIIEDIVDTGLTMSYLLENLRTRKPASIKVCSLLHKPARSIKEVPIDYLGFTIEDLFVCGYGLDYKQMYRSLPYVGVLKSDEQ